MRTQTKKTKKGRPEMWTWEVPAVVRDVRLNVALPKLLYALPKQGHAVAQLVEALLYKP